MARPAFDRWFGGRTRAGGAGAVPRSPHRRAGMLVVGAALLGCGAPSAHPTPRVAPRYWVVSPGDSSAVAAVLASLHAAVAESLRDVPLAAGYPRGCAVTGTPPPRGPWYPACEEDIRPHDALKLSADSGDFLQFVTLDFPSPRVFTFEVYLLPDRRTAALDLAELAEYPRVAIPPFGLRPSNFREMLAAVADGILAVGAVPLTP